MKFEKGDFTENEGVGGFPERTKDIIEQLVSLRYECASCLNNIRCDVAVWSCNECFCIFHLYCIKKWAKQDESGSGLSFRCPHCQATHPSIPKYFCFCGKARDPPYDPHITPHSCGQSCGKSRPFCQHPCPVQCHPGPCPSCTATAGPRACSCGATTYTWRCGQQDPQKTCSNTCSKLLNCGIHNCTRTCHWDDCDLCPETVKVTCYCRLETREMPCGSSMFSCGKVCGKKLRCGIHACDLVCHTGSCPPCNRDPSVISTCPCGVVPLTIVRTHCSDPIPACANACGRVLDCGRHTCQENCHDGACKPCKERLLTRCVCGATQESVPCKDQAEFRCNKACKTRLTCGKHECRLICCSARKKTNDSVHQCMRVCNKKLPCDHECLEPCHRGLCPPCAHVVSERLFCRCGAESLMPPQPCGTLPPKCSRPCTITPPCNHPSARHSCHYGDCPPCTFPVERLCAGGHTLVRNVLCSAAYASCNGKCGKLLSCGHECQRSCHTGPCIDESHPCLRPCGKVHEECGHSCKAKCHSSKGCPQCAETVECCCACGRQIQRVSCKKFLRYLDEHPEKKFSLNCNADCLFEQRLQILSSRVKIAVPSAVKYSLFLWSLAVKNPEWVRVFEEELGSFVSSGAPFKCLKPMRAEKRAFVHSLCQYYYIHSESVDPEPNRSCLLTRTPKIRIPVPLLSEAVAEDEKHNPSNFVKEICGNNELFYSRVIVMKGENVNTVSVSRVLEEFIGDFVCDAEEMLSDGTKRLKVFFTHQTKQQHAYRHLRSTGPPFQFFIPRMTEEQPLKEKKVLGSSSWANSVWCRRNNPK